MANELHKGEDFPVKSRAAASSTVRFLHLSDLHFCNPLSVEHDLMMTNLLHDISRLDHGRDLDFAVVSGDVTWSGKKGEYRMAAQHLGRILSAAKVPIGNTIFVPGNHDVDRGKASSLMRSNFYTEPEIARILANRRDVAFLSKKFQNYKRFLDSYLGADNHGFTYGHPFYSKLLEVRGFRIGVAALNTALFSQQDEEFGRLAVGELQLRVVIRELENFPDRDLNIAVFHHPWNFLADFDWEAIHPLLLANFDILLSGHVHRAYCWRMENPDGHIQILNAGSSYAGRQWMSNSYSVVSLNTENMVGTVSLKRWTNEGGGRWDPDIHRFDPEKQVDIGTVEFSLAEDMKLRHDHSQTANLFSLQRTLQKMRPIADKCREHLVEDRSYVRLRFTKLRNDEAQERSDLEAYLDNWMTEESEQVVFLMGDYGRGKSRFLRHYSGALAQRFLQAPEHSRIPILVTLDQTPSRGSFRDLVEMTLIEKYSTTVSYDDLVQLMRNGRVVVLIDGLGELAFKTKEDYATHEIYERFSGLSQCNCAGNKVIIASRPDIPVESQAFRRILANRSLEDMTHWGVHKLAEGSSVDVDFMTLYLPSFAADQMQEFIKRHPCKSDRKQLVETLLHRNKALNDLARRPVILKLLLETHDEVLRTGSAQRVSELYHLITEAWIARELDRLGNLEYEERREELADCIRRVVEVVAFECMQGTRDTFDLESIKKIWQRECPEEFANAFSSSDFTQYVFIAPEPSNRLRFGHRSFVEFLVARRFLRNLRDETLSGIEQKLPPIGVLDFLRGMLDEETALHCQKLLRQPRISPNIKVSLIIGLRQFPELSRSDLEKVVFDGSEAFGVRRVAAMSLAESDQEPVRHLVSLLRHDKIIQHQNLEFLKELWRADRAEIARRTRFRLENRENRERPYWDSARSIYLLTLGHSGDTDDISLLEEFLNDDDPIVVSCARDAMERISFRHSPEEKELDRRINLAMRAAVDAGEVLVKRFRGQNARVSMMPCELTTEADIESQEIILSLIRRYFPNDAIISEEEDGQARGRAVGRYRWIVDPLDGTANYCAGIERFCIAIAIERSGEPCASLIYLPIRSEYYWARKGAGAFHGEQPLLIDPAGTDEDSLVAYANSSHDKEMAGIGSQLFKAITAEFRSVRIYGAASLDFCDMAEGYFDGLVKVKGRPWDSVPGAFLVKEAAGIVEQVGYDRSNGIRSIVCGNRSELVQKLKSMMVDALS